MLDSLLQILPSYVLVFFRVAGMMVFAPLIGSVRIPKRVRLLLSIVLAIGLAPGIAPPMVIPNHAWELAVGIGGEMAFGLAIGTILSFTFIAAQWAGEIVGQQMGINLGSTFDPTYGGGGSVIGDMYFMLTLVIFISINGHHALLIGVRRSFDALPLLSVGLDHSLFDLLIRLLHACTMLAFQLAAPVLMTMLIVDLALGFIGKTVPQLNVMTAGMSVRGLVAILVMILGLSLTSTVIRNALVDAMMTVVSVYTTKS